VDVLWLVEILVNNVGFGLGCGFLLIEVVDEEWLFDVYCCVVFVFIYVAVWVMCEWRSGMIINVSLVVGFVVLGIYLVVKVWSIVFSEVVVGQLVLYGVCVMVVCPGFVRMEFYGCGGMDMLVMFDLAWFDVDDFVDEVLVDVVKGKVVSVLSKRFKIVVLVFRHLS